ncbi:PAS and ANTAR domain-containing protein [Nocardia cyriacigeorgica]|uniref:PAS and ANTAR domain-containing protein n=1 Tax=Nocardia cyriacigeorgica TaxID=135487 RepID=UPI001893D6DF|nr:PAS and ANTAR domain-containing protein [Nocardia cyriacigeorgica]MBF6435377.1 PAS and ANTAR domain-containing protein [Nocardia cyriacigeorgica]
MRGESEPGTTVHPLEAVAGEPQRMGILRLWFTDEHWAWSDEAARLYGYEPGEVEPTTELLLSHKHPDDREGVARCIAQAIETGEPFSSRHRIVDTAGQQHHVIVVGEPLVEDGVVVGATGYCVDVTGSFDVQRKEILDETVPDIIHARSVIEQAKGALMLIYGLSADEAFRVLRWRSQETNIKLRDFAELLVAALPTQGEAPAQQRIRFDHVLLTVHRRLGGDGTAGVDHGGSDGQPDEDSA